MASQEGKGLRASCVSASSPCAHELLSVFLPGYRSVGMSFLETAIQQSGSQVLWTVGEMQTCHGD